MPCFRLTGIDRESGYETSVVIEAGSENDAANEAIVRGISVTHVEAFDRSLADRIAGLPASIVVASCVAAFTIIIMLIIAATSISNPQPAAPGAFDESSRRDRYEQLQERLNDPVEIARQQESARKQAELDRQQKIAADQAAADERESIERSIANLIERGYVKSIGDGQFGVCQAQVTPLFMGLDYDDKRTIISLIYLYRFGGTDMSKTVELIHSRSGVRVAVMSRWDGIKFFQ